MTVSTLCKFALNFFAYISPRWQKIIAVTILTTIIGSQVFLKITDVEFKYHTQFQQSKKMNLTTKNVHNNKKWVSFHIKEKSSNKEQIKYNVL